MRKPGSFLVSGDCVVRHAVLPHHIAQQQDRQRLTVPGRKLKNMAKENRNRRLGHEWS